MSALRRGVAALAAVAAVLLTGAPAAAHPRPVPSPRQQGAEVELTAQTPTVPRQGVFNVRFRLHGVPDDGSVRLILHDRVRSRSELEASMDGDALRRELRDVTTPISELATAPDGSLQATLSFDPGAPSGIRLAASGAYPLQVIATDASLAPVAELVTHVIAEPAEEDESPALAVATVVELGTDPALQPDGTVSLGDLAEEQRLAAALAAVPGAAATLDIAPETLDALAARGQDDDLALLDALRAAAVDRAVLARPYVDVSLQALASAGMGDQIEAVLARGRLALADALGVDPDPSSWLAAPDLGRAGLAALEDLGTEHVVVDPDQVEPIASGTLALSPAKPFLLAPPGNGSDASELDAIATDPRIEERVDAEDPAPLAAHRLLAELAVLWLEQPGVDRGVVVPVDGSLPDGALEVVLRGLDGARMFEAVTLTELFDRVDPLLDAAGSPLERALDPEASSTFSREEATAVAGGWARLATLRSLLGPESPRTAAVVDHLLLATAVDLRPAERRAHLDAALSRVDEVTAAISANRRTTVTLTARDGTVPLTLRNDAGVPVNVVIHLRSSKLDFPQGETIPLTLTEETTRLELAVEARTSGAFPLDVTVTAPDGSALLAETRYTVRSTAVSGAGLVLSLGAGLFLVVWWARHWRKTRRSTKLIDTPHPAARSHASAAR